MTLKASGTAVPMTRKSLEKILSLNENEFSKITSNTFKEIYQNFVNFFTKSDKNFTIKSIKDHLRSNFQAVIKLTITNFSLPYFLIGLNFLLIGIFLGYLLSKTFLWKYITIKSNTFFFISKFIYIALNLTTISSFFMNYGNTMDFSKLNLNMNFRMLLFVLIAIFSIFILSYVFFLLFVITSKLGFMLYTFTVGTICYLAFLINLNINTGLITLERGLAFSISMTLFLIIAYFFYNYINEVAIIIKNSLKSLLYYFPVVLTFILITSIFEYLQIEFLRNFLLPYKYESLFSLGLRTVIHGISSDFSKSFLFTLCLGWIYSVISNLNVLFVCSLLSNNYANENVIHNDYKSRIKFFLVSLSYSLKVCFNNFGSICYQSLIPGFICSMKSTLIFFNTLIEQVDIPFIRYVVHIPTHCILSVLDGLEIFFGSYNQVSFVILAYEQSMLNFGHKKMEENNEKGDLSLNVNETNSNENSKNIINDSSNLFSTASQMNSKVLEHHPESLIINSPKFLNLIFSTQPNSLFGFLFLNMDLNVNSELKKYFFPGFLCFQLISELILLIGAVIVLQRHHNLVKNEELTTKGLKESVKEINLKKVVE